MKSLSRTAIEQYIRCPRCFYLQRKLGLRPPAMVPLTLAVATDALLKNEFDAVRKTQSNHPLWQREGLNVRAFDHPDIDLWRSNFKGMRVSYADGFYEIFGAVDDIWINCQTQELHIVDYKSTSKADEPSLEGGFGDGYKRQMEIYQWLFRTSGYQVSNVGYFLYVNGSKKNRFYDDNLNGWMKFNTNLISYVADDSWVEDAVKSSILCLEGEAVPKSGNECENCRYYNERQNL